MYKFNLSKRLSRREVFTYLDNAENIPLRYKRETPSQVGLCTIK